MNSARSVSQVIGQVRQQIEAQFHSLWIRGEVTELRQSQGHLYFRLKDEGASLKACIWASRRPNLQFAPVEGDIILAQGRLELYPLRGQLQMVIEQLIPDGPGQLLLAIDKMRRKMQAEGLFDPARKKPIPYFPRRVGVVTSPEGAVWHDICSTVERRNPCVQLILSPSQVQGFEAPQQMEEALTRLLEAEVDCVILARGGGSFEDLLPFNHQRLVRFLASYPLPLLSAIGHETDTTLCDLVSDYRAATPTAAAERVAPERQMLLVELQQARNRLELALQQRLSRSRERLESLASRPCFGSAQLLIQSPTRQLEQLRGRLLSGFPARLAQLRSQWVGHQAALDPIRWKQRVQAQQDQLAQLRQRLLSGLSSRCWRERPQLTSWTFQLPQLMQHQLERERAVWRDLRSRLKVAGARLGQGEAARQQQWFARIKSAMQNLLKANRSQLEPLQTQTQARMLGRLGQQRSELDNLQSVLAALSPERPLQLGYALVRDGQGNLVSSVNGRKAHEAVEIALADGHLECRIEHIRAQPGSRTTA